MGGNLEAVLDSEPVEPINAFILSLCDDVIWVSSKEGVNCSVELLDVCVCPIEPSHGKFHIVKPRIAHGKPETAVPKKKKSTCGGIDE